MISAILQPGRLVTLLEGLRRELQPKSLIDELLLREIARHAAMLGISEQAEWAAMRQGVAGKSTILNISVPNQNRVLALATSVTSEPLERLTRYRRAGEKAIHQAINKMIEQRQTRATGRSRALDSPTDPFATEEACRDHLRARFRRADWTCPGCGGSRGHWLGARLRWECGACGRQIGLRFGTVSEGSPLPLVAWFLAIRCVTNDGATSAVKFRKLISIGRPATG